MRNPFSGRVLALTVLGIILLTIGGAAAFADTAGSSTASPAAVDSQQAVSAPVVVAQLPKTDGKSPGGITPADDIPPQISVTPTSLSKNLGIDELTDETITVGNTGGSPLTFTSTIESAPEPQSVRTSVAGASPIIPGKPLPSKPMIYRAGGPDSYGYVWKDSDEPGGPAFDLVEIRTTGTEVTGLSDDNFVGPFPIGFSFRFYGQTFSEFYVCSNGYIGFGPTESYSSPEPGSNVIAWFLSNLAPGPLSHVYYQSTPEGLYIEFVDYSISDLSVPTSIQSEDPNAVITAQIILRPNGDIVLQYLSIGSSFPDENGMIGMGGVESGFLISGMEPYIHPNLAIRIGRQPWLRLDVTGATVAPAETSQFTATIDSSGLTTGSYSAVIALNSNDPVASRFAIPVDLTVQGFPDISIFPDTLDFGTVYTGYPSVRTIGLHNSGSDPLDVASITSDNTAITPEWTSLVLAAGASVDLQITCTPTAAESLTATLTLNCNDPDSPTINIPVTATVVDPPVIMVDPSEINATVESGLSTTQTLTIGNFGASDLSYTLVLGIEGDQAQFAAAESVLTGVGKSAGHNKDGLVVAAAGVPTGLVGMDDVGWVSCAASPVALTCIAADPTSGMLYAQQNEGVQFYRYDPIANSWATVAQCPIYSGNNGGAEYLNGKIYTTYTNNDDSVGIYDVATDSWTTMSNGDLYGTAVIATDGTDLYLMDDQYVKRYSPDSGSWEYLPVAPFQQDEWGSMDYSDGYLYLARGDGYTQFARFDIDGNSWESLPDVPGGAVLGGAIDPLGRAFYTYGDYGENNLYRFDMWSESWYTSAIPALSGLEDGGMAYSPAPTPRIYAAAGEDGTGFAYIDLSDWLMVAPLSGHVAPGESSDLTVTLNAEDIYAGEYYGTIFINSNDPGSSQVEVPVTLTVTGTPDIAVEPTSVDMGLTYIGYPTSRTFTIYNNGTGELSISTITSDNPTVSVLSYDSVIGPKSATQVVVEYAPSAVETMSAHLIIESDDPDAPSLQVAVSGTSLQAPVAGVTPSSLSKTLESGTAAQDVLNIGNTGVSGLDYSVTIVFDEGGTPPPQTVMSLGSWLTVTPSSGQVEPGVSTQLVVSFNATGLMAGEYSATIRVLSNDPASPQIDIPVSLSVWGTPNIEATPTTIDFGSTFVGRTETATVTVRNTGTDTLTVPSVTTSHPAVNASPSGFAVAPGGSQDISVQYVPTEAETLSITLTINSNDPDTAAVEIPVSAVTTLPPTITVDPTSISESLNAGDILHDALTISNTGGTALTFSATVEYDEPAGSAIAAQPKYSDEFYQPIPKKSPETRVGPPVIQSSGGPDAFGYRWQDSDQPGGPVFNWVDVSATGTSVYGFSDDNYVGPFPIGFGFSYYGNTYDQFWISSNGFIGFGPPNGYNYLGNVVLPRSDAPNNIIAWAWDDLYPTQPFSVYYESRSEGLVVQFNNYAHINNSADRITAEVILKRNGDILLQYQNVVNMPTGYSVGMENATGTQGLTVAIDPVSGYLRPNLAVRFSARSWLQIEPAEGSIEPGANQALDVAIDASSLVAGDYTANIAVQSNDPANPTVNVPVNVHVDGIPQISVNATSLDFGTIFLGYPATRQVTVSNPGTSPLVVSSIVSSDASVGISHTAFTLAPATSQVVTLTFDPAEPATLNGTLTITSNDLETPEIAISMTGAAILVPILGVDPTSITETLEVGVSTAATVTLSNTGGSDLIFSVSNPDLGWCSASPTSGTVTPGGSQPLTVSLSANSLVVGDYSTSIRINSNDPARASVNIPISLHVWGTPNISVNPTSVAFGSVFFPHQWTQTFVVTNTGTDRLDITGITSGAASVTVAPSAFNLSPNGTRTVTVTYDAQQSETLATTLTIASNDPDTASLEIPVTALSASPPAIVASPTSLAKTLEAGASATDTLTVGNSGESDLHFTAEVVYDEPGSTAVQSYSDEFYKPLAKGVPDTRKGYPVIQNHGGPDTYGYRWSDSNESGGPVYSWIDIQSTGTQIGGLSDDSYVGPFPIGFNFPFYGTGYNQFWVSSNGFIGFGPANDYSSLSNTPMPSTGTPNNIIAFMWDDLYPNGNISYQTRPEGLVIQWTNWRRYGRSTYITGQAILKPSGEILLQYNTFSSDWPFNDATVGIENATGTDGLTVCHNTNYIQPQMAIRLSPLSWLRLNPAQGTVAGSADLPLDVTFDASALVEGDYSANIALRSDDPATPTLSVPVSLHIGGIPDVSVTPSSVGFGAVFIGFPATRDITVTNPGTATLAVTGIVSNNPAVTASADAFTLGPNESRTVTLTYAPTAVETLTGVTVVVNSDDLETPAIPVTVTGSSLAPPVFGTDPASVTASVESRSSTTATLTINNTGGSQLQFSISNIGAGWCSVYPASGTVAAGGSTLLTVTLNAASLQVGDYTTTIRFTSNDPALTSADIPVSLHVWGIPNIQVTPVSLDFGRMYVGHPKTLDVTVKNTGTNTLSITGITSDHSAVTASENGFTLAPLAEKKVTIRYAPTAVETLAASIGIASDDPDSPSTAISVVANSIEPPVIGVTPISLSRNLEAGQAAEDNIEIGNTGATDLEYDIDIIYQSQGGTSVKAQYDAAYFKELPKGAKDPRIGSPITQGAGGPDTYGYWWKDSNEVGGPIFDWVDISGTGTRVTGFGDDNFIGPFPINFDFPFYGTNQNQFWITSNGYIGFGSGSGFGSYGNVPLPSAGAPNNAIYWCWRDLYPKSDTAVYYYSDGNQLVVQYNNYGCYGAPNERITAEVILRPSGEILVQYQSFTPGWPVSACSVGIENEAGNDALQVAFNTAYLQPNLALRFGTQDWLRANPVSGTVPAGGSDPVSIYYNTADLVAGSYSANLRVASNDPATPVKTVPVSLTVTGIPNISASPAEVNFGPVYVGFPATRDVVVTNVGSDALHVTDILSAAPNLTITTPTAFTVAAHQTRIVTLRYNPTSNEALNTSITITSDDPDTGTLVVPVVGTGALAPTMTITPASLTKSIPAETSGQEIFIIGNTGLSDLQFTLAPQSASWMTLSPTTATVAPGASTPVTVNFIAGQMSASTYNGSILVTSNDPTRPSVTVPVTFTVVMTAPEAPLGPNPADGAAGVQIDATLQWQRPLRAGAYDLYLWPASESKPQTPTASPYGGSYKPASPLAQNTSYKWQVVAKNIAGNTEGPEWTFETERMPDLQVASVEVPAVAYSGQSVQVSWRVTNNGAAATDNPVWHDRVYLSESPTLDTVTARDLGSFPNGSYLAPGESYVSTHSFTLDNGISGAYYIFVTADSWANVREGSETNNTGRNTAAMQVNLTPPPDLQVTSIVAPTTSFSGQQIPITWTVTNNGTGDTLVDYWAETVYLSQDETLNTSTARNLGSFNNLSGLPHGTSYTQSRNISLPNAFSGDYYVYVVTDRHNHVYEHAGEDNNTGRTVNRMSITLAPPPDLEVTQVGVPAAASSGRPVTITWQVANHGPGETIETGWSDRVYLSTSPTFDQAATELGTYYHSGRLGPDAVYDRSEAITLANGLSGTYYVYVHTDFSNGVFEHIWDDNNVTGSPSAMTVSLSTPPDLQVTTVNLPEVGWSGQPMSVSWTVRNTGEGTTYVTSWQDSIYLSVDESIGGDTYLGSYTRNGVLDAGGSYTGTQTVALPHDIQGRHYILVKSDSDNRVYEHTAEAEANNWKAAELQVALTPRPDLTVSSVIAPAEASSGLQIDVDWTTTNSGTGPTRSDQTWWYDTIYLSSDTTVNSGDTELGSQWRSGVLAAGRSYTQRRRCTLPNGIAGEYYVLVVTDNGHNANEANDSNNTGQTAGRMNISLSPSVDLQVASVDAPTLAETGQPINISWRTVNNGTAATDPGDWYDSVFLSRDTILDGGDTQVGWFYHAGVLQPAGGYDASGTCTIPSGFEGNYYVLVQTDSNNRVYEHGAAANNNVGSDGDVLAVSVTPIGARDLVVATVTVAPTGVVGQMMAVSWTGRNDGTGILSGYWEDVAYLSADDTWGIGDPELGRVAENRTLAPGGTYSVSANMVVPAVTPGTYNVIVRADIRNQIREASEINNTGVSTPAGIDCQALLLGTPSAGSVWTGVERYYKVSVPAGEDLLIKLDCAALSGANELYVRYGAMADRIHFDYAYSAPFQPDQEIVVPSTLPGDYYILVRGASIPAQADYTILASLLEFGVRSATPNVGGNTGKITTDIIGARLSEYTQAKLVMRTEPAGAPEGNQPSVTSTTDIEIPAERIYFRSTSKITAVFDLNDAPVGTYDLVLVNPSGMAAVMEDGFTVEQGRQARVSARLVAPPRCRPGREYTVWLEYSNPGNVDAQAPWFIVSSSDVLMRAERDDDYTAAPVQVLGIDFNGLAGTLPPGASYSIPVYFKAEALPRIRFHLSRVPVSDTPVDWPTVEQQMKPASVDPAVWDPAFAQFKDQAGDTWGSFVGMLDDTATRLSLRGDYKYLIKDLVSFPMNVGYGHPVASISGLARRADNGQFLQYARVVARDDTGYTIRSGDTGMDGRFIIEGLPAGTYILSIEGYYTGEPVVAPVPPNADVTGVALNVYPVPADQDIVTDPQPIADSDPAITTDASGNAHMVWMRGEEIWHAVNSGSGWSVTGRVANAEGSEPSVAFGPTIYDGTTPGIMVVWQTGFGNEAKLAYSVGHDAAGAYVWTAPEQLTSDTFGDYAAVPVILNSGETMVLWLQRDYNVEDDGDLYYKVVGSTSTALWTAPQESDAMIGPIQPASETCASLAFKKGTALPSSVPLIGGKYGYEVAGQICGGQRGKPSCDAWFKGGVGLTVNLSDNLEGSGSANVQATWSTNAESCAYVFNNASVELKGGGTGHIPLWAPPIPIPGVKIDVGGVIEGEVSGTLSWSSGNFPGWPDGGGAQIRVGAGPYGRFKAEVLGCEVASGEIKGVGSVIVAYQAPDKWDFLSYCFELTAEGKFLDAKYTWSNKWGPCGDISALSTQKVDPKRVLTTAYRVYDGVPSLSTMEWSIDPLHGTGNKYEGDTVLADITGDTRDDLPAAVAKSSSGEVLAAWAKQNADPAVAMGSSVYVAGFDGTTWSAPTNIDGPGYFDKDVSLTYDSNGVPMVVWSAATANVTLSSTGQQYLNALNAADIRYARRVDGTWTAPATLAALPGRDDGVKIAAGASGQIVAAWMNTDPVANMSSIYVSLWDGAVWSLPLQMASSPRCGAPAVGYAGGNPMVVWGQDTDGNAETQADQTLYTSTYNGTAWSTPTALAKPIPVVKKSTTAAVLDANGFPIQDAAAAERIKALNAAYAEGMINCPTCAMNAESARMKIMLSPGSPPDECCEDECDEATEDCDDDDPDEPEPPDDDDDEDDDDADTTGIWPTDPNEMVGPAGYGEQAFVALKQAMPYSIYFENMPTALAPATQVRVTEQLDSNLDWRSFRLGEIVFGSKIIQVPENRSFYQYRCILDDGNIVDISAGLDVTTGQVQWLFRTLDPATGEAPADPNAGFLPPNDDTGRGEGHVTYTIKPKPGAHTGDVAKGIARIVFDTELPIDTNEVSNTVDAVVPPSSVAALPEVAETPAFTVSWSGADDTGGSGIGSYTIHVSEGDGPYTMWQADVTDTSAEFTGEPGKTYRFFSVAKDNAGNIEESPVEPDAVIHVPQTAPTNPNPADGATGVVPSMPLTWTAGYGSISHDVYVWKDGAAKPAIPTVAGLTEARYQPSSPLDYASGYHWQVVEHGSAGDVPGDEWTFATAPVPAAKSMLESKESADGTSVSISGVVVTAVLTDAFYVETTDRATGLRVQWNGAPVTVGTSVTVTGVLETNDDFERFLFATHVLDAAPTNPIDPVGINVRNLGGSSFRYDAETGAGQIGMKAYQTADLGGGVSGRALSDVTGTNNIGLLVRIWGIVSAEGDGYFYLNDGSTCDDGNPAAKGVKVLVPAGMTDVPDPGARLSVTGISSCYESGGVAFRQIRVWRASDIAPL